MAQLSIMITLTANDIKKIAHLARLEITAKDIPTHAKNLTNILTFVGQINNINTNNINPMVHPQDIKQRLRTDEVTEIIDKDKFQQIAPQTEAGLYLVPKVI
jgi:aspartyl-tRNA(Asn)/glutamyl-tRNA(Gln) amidotransferase subunit C